MAILTPAQVKGSYLPSIKVASTDQDTEIAAKIEQADQLIATYIGRPLNAAGDRTLGSVAYDEYKAPPHTKTLYLNGLPVTAIASVYRVSSSGTETLIDSDDYAQRGGSIRLLSSSEWASLGEEIRVKYTGGHATLPEVLRHATGLLVGWLWRQPHTQGLTNKSTAGRSVALVASRGIPEHIRAILPVASIL